MSLVLNGSEIEFWSHIYNVHSPEICGGRICVVHNPLMGPWRDAPLVWRNDRKFVERVCVHDVGHPDPSQLPHWAESGQMDAAIHGCDGCCYEWKLASWCREDAIDVDYVWAEAELEAAVTVKLEPRDQHARWEFPPDISPLPEPDGPGTDGVAMSPGPDRTPPSGEPQP